MRKGKVKVRRGGKRGTKKYGRNKAKCARYRLLGIREKNKARRMAKQRRKEAKKRARKARQ